MLYKKIITVILSLCMILPLIPSVKVSAESNSSELDSPIPLEKNVVEDVNRSQEESPITSISIINAANVKPDEKLKFHMNFDEDYGVTAIELWWKPEEDRTGGIYWTFDNIQESGTFEYQLPPNVKPGKYEIVEVDVYSQKDGRGVYKGPELSNSIFKGLNFTVEDIGQDTEPPIVSNIHIVTNPIEAPGDVIVEFNITDEAGVITSEHTEWPPCEIQYRLYNDFTEDINPGTSNQIQHLAYKKVGKDTYQAVIHMNSPFERFYFYKIIASDSLGNYAEYNYKDLNAQGKADIIPEGFTEDTMSPQMLSYSFEKESITVPDTLDMTVKFEDLGLPISYTDARVYFCKADGTPVYEKTWCDNKNYDTSQHVGFLNFETNIRYGSLDSDTEIYLNKIILTDLAGNQTEYSLAKGNLKKKTVKIHVSDFAKDPDLVINADQEIPYDKLSNLPEKSTVVYFLGEDNHGKEPVIPKEFFDCIRGKDITVVFHHYYLTAHSILNGKDIIGQTYDTSMWIQRTEKRYSKYLVSGYEIADNAGKQPGATWESVVEYKKQEIKKYFDQLRSDGYILPDDILEQAYAHISEGPNEDIIREIDPVTYLELRLDETRPLPFQKVTIRMKPSYSCGHGFDTDKYYLYCGDIANAKLIQEVPVDEDDCCQFAISNDQTYYLSEKPMEVLKKQSNPNPGGGEVNPPVPVPRPDPKPNPDSKPEQPDASDGWHKNQNGVWEFTENGKPVANQWKKDNTGWCYLDSNGNLATKQWAEDSHGWCYLDKEGHQAFKTWARDSKDWCYVDENGYMVKDQWQKDSQGWCHVGSDGRMQRSIWVQDSVDWCYVDENGYMVKDQWQKDSQGWCYIGADGRLLRNGYAFDSTGKHYLDEEGHMAW